MVVRKNRKRGGFTLTELSIVLAVMGLVLSGVWVAVHLASQSAKVEQSTEAISLIVDSTRVAYGNQSAIYGGVASVVPLLVNMGSMPTHLVNATATACQGTTSNYADTPWGGTDPCGTLRMCAWTVGTNTQCGTPSNPASSQYFSVEFSSLDYPSCVALATRAKPTVPATGLADIYVNGASGLAAAGIPLPPANANTMCTKASTTNVIDFIYALRAPVS